MSNNWIEHVKAYSKKNNVPYKQALKDAKSTYSKSGNKPEKMVEMEVEKKDLKKKKSK
jgi:hypothetical protein